MRLIVGLILICLLAATAFAQDRNFPAALGAGLPSLNSSGPSPGLNYSGFSNFPAALGTGLPPLNSSSRPPGLNYGGFSSGDGYVYGFDGYGYAAPYPNAPRFVVLVPQPVVPAAPPAPPTPPEPIHSSIQNVKGYPKQNPSTAPPAFFIIVLNNGSRLTASAVSVQGNGARYMDGDGQVHRVPLADVDRTATRALNQTNHLNLRLPPE
jgi:hypothetical protein